MSAPLCMLSSNHGVEPAEAKAYRGTKADNFCICVCVHAAIVGGHGGRGVRRVQEGAAGGQSVLPGPDLLCVTAALSLRLLCLQERHWVLEEQEERGGAVSAHHRHQLLLPGVLSCAVLRMLPPLHLCFAVLLMVPPIHLCCEMLCCAADASFVLSNAVLNERQR